MSGKLPNLSDMKITVSGNLISVDIVDTPLVEVLNYIEIETGIEGHFLGNLSELVTLSFPPISIEKGLWRLVGDNSVSFIYKEQKTGHSITEIWVIDESFSGEPLAHTGISKHIEPVTEIKKEPAGNLSDLEQNLHNLVAQGDAMAVMSIAAQLGSVRVEERKLLVDAIGLIRNEHSTQILGQILYGDPEPEIRMLAIRYLSQRIDEPAAKAMMEGGINDPDDEVRRFAGQLLEDGE